MSANPTEARRLAKSQKDRADYDARQARRVREAEEEARAAARKADADRLAAETARVDRERRARLSPKE